MRVLARRSTPRQNPQALHLKRPSAPRLRARQARSRAPRHGGQLRHPRVITDIRSVPEHRRLRRRERADTAGAGPCLGGRPVDLVDGHDRSSRPTTSIGEGKHDTGRGHRLRRPTRDIDSDSPHTAGIHTALPFPKQTAYFCPAVLPRTLVGHASWVGDRDGPCDRCEPRGIESDASHLGS
jgi:hypothetical protein